jgi:hypothetical protein
MNYTKQTWADGTTGGTPLSAARLNNMEAGIASANTTLNVKDYGAVGDGTADDTAAFQAAINAAATINGTVVIPNPPTGGYYKLTSTVTIKPQGSDTQTWLELRGGGKNGTIRWAGAANTPVFQCYGWKRGGADNIRIDISGAAGVIAWDVDTTVTYGSLSGVSWTRCFVEMGTTAGVGWRVGHVSGGIADISFCEWRNCTVNGNSGGTVTAGSRGWLIEGINTLNNYWFGGSAAFIDKAVSNSGATTGNDSMFFYGFGTTHTLTDFTFDAPGAYVISGGRFEDGKRFLDVLGPSSNHPAVVVQGINISGHTPTDGILVNFSRPGSLLWDGNFIKSSGSNYTAAAFTFDGFTGLGTFHVRGGGIQAADPFWTIVPGASWQVWTEGVGLLNSSRQSVTRVATRLGDVTPGDPNPANRYIAANLAWYVNPVTEDVRTLTPTLNSLVLHLFHSGAEGVTIDKLDAFVNTVGGTGAVLRAGRTSPAHSCRRRARSCVLQPRPVQVHVQILGDRGHRLGSLPQPAPTVTEQDARSRRPASASQASSWSRAFSSSCADSGCDGSHSHGAVGGGEVVDHRRRQVERAGAGEIPVRLSAALLSSRGAGLGGCRSRCTASPCGGPRRAAPTLLFRRRPPASPRRHRSTRCASYRWSRRRLRLVVRAALGDAPDVLAKPLLRGLTGHAEHLADLCPRRARSRLRVRYPSGRVLTDQCSQPDRLEVQPLPQLAVGLLCLPRLKVEHRHRHTRDAAVVAADGADLHRSEAAVRGVPDRRDDGVAQLLLGVAVALALAPLIDDAPVRHVGHLTPMCARCSDWQAARSVRSWSVRSRPQFAHGSSSGRTSSR